MESSQKQLFGVKLTGTFFYNKRYSFSLFQDEDDEYSLKLLSFTVETICFWTRKLTYFPYKSNFSKAYE